jgi:pimeloyl-ACP methyl ester carboxylesterase
MLVELVTVTTGDGVELDGAVHGSGARPPASILMVHGLTWNFYRGMSRWLPPMLAEAGYPCLSLNMRDHDLREPKDFELAFHDLRAGVDYLWQRWEGPVVVLGHGYACNKVVCYPAQSEDRRVRRFVLTTLGSVKNYRPDIWDTVLKLAPQLGGQALVIQGAIDPSLHGRARADELAAAATSATAEIVLLEGANHYFDGRRRELADCIVEWLGRRLSDG